MPDYPSQTDRAGVWVSIAHRDSLNDSAKEIGVTQREAAEALIDLLASGDVEILKLVKAYVASTRQT